MAAKKKALVVWDCADLGLPVVAKEGWTDVARFSAMGIADRCVIATDSAEVADDGKSVTFHLRPEARFADGTPLTADDVASMADGAVVFVPLIHACYEYQPIETTAPAGQIVELKCTYDPQTRGKNPSDGRKVKGVIHWVSAAHARDAEVRLYDRLFRSEHPGADGTDPVLPGL